MQDGFKDKDIEFALYVLQYTENKEDDEIQVWLKEKEHRDLLEELRRFREAGMWEAEKLDVDEDYQWQLLERRAVLRKRKRNIRRILTGVAAVVIMSVVASVYIYYRQEENLIKEISQISLNAETDAVRLITGKGEEYILASSAPNNNDTLEKRGIVIDSVGGLKYMRILHDTTRSEEFHTLRVPRGGEYILVFFGDDVEKAEKLDKAIAAIRAKYGKKSVGLAAMIEQDFIYDKSDAEDFLPFKR